MSQSPIADWDDAYANAAHISGGADYPEKWATQATAFRNRMLRAKRLRTEIAYGPHDRNRYDLVLPAAHPRGLVVFVHGGYWMAFDKSSWSHLAEGPLAHGFAVALLSYPLCPDVRICTIARQVATAIEAAAKEIAGPIHLAGHSAGGHLVAEMMTMNTPLPQAVRARIRKVVSIPACTICGRFCAWQ